MTVSTETTAGSPPLTVEQGGPGSGVATPGQVAIVWDNFATAAPVQRRRDRDEGVHPHYGVEPSRPGRFGPRSRRSRSIPTVATASGFSVVSGTPQDNSRTSLFTRSLTQLLRITRLANHRRRPLARDRLGQHPGGLQPVPGDALRRLRRSFPVRPRQIPSPATPIPPATPSIYLITSSNGGLSWSIPCPGRPGQRG